MASRKEPAGLWLVHDSENILDAVCKGRKKAKCGSSHGQSILSEADVLEMRRIYDAAPTTGSGRKANGTRLKLAKQFNTTKENVQLICSRRAWTHI